MKYPNEKPGAPEAVVLDRSGSLAFVDSPPAWIQPPQVCLRRVVFYPCCDSSAAVMDAHVQQPSYQRKSAASYYRQFDRMESRGPAC